MGLRVQKRKRVGLLNINTSKSGVSTSFSTRNRKKGALNVTFNPKYGMTLSLYGTGIAWRSRSTKSKRLKRERLQKARDKDKLQQEKLKLRQRKQRDLEFQKARETEKRAKLKKDALTQKIEEKRVHVIGSFTDKAQTVVKKSQKLCEDFTHHIQKLDNNDRLQFIQNHVEWLSLEIDKIIPAKLSLSIDPKQIAGLKTLKNNISETINRKAGVNNIEIEFESNSVRISKVSLTELVHEIFYNRVGEFIAAQYTETYIDSLSADELEQNYLSLYGLGEPLPEAECFDYSHEIKKPFTGNYHELIILACTNINSYLESVNDDNEIDDDELDAIEFLYQRLKVIIEINSKSEHDPKTLEAISDSLNLLIDEFLVDVLYSICEQHDQNKFSFAGPDVFNTAITKVKFLCSLLDYMMSLYDAQSTAHKQINSHFDNLVHILHEQYQNEVTFLIDSIQLVKEQKNPVPDVFSDIDDAKYRKIDSYFAKHKLSTLNEEQTKVTEFLSSHILPALKIKSLLSNVTYQGKKSNEVLINLGDYLVDNAIKLHFYGATNAEMTNELSDIIQIENVTEDYLYSSLSKDLVDNELSSLLNNFQILLDKHDVTPDSDDVMLEAPTEYVPLSFSSKNKLTLLLCWLLGGGLGIHRLFCGKYLSGLLMIILLGIVMYLSSEEHYQEYGTYLTITWLLWLFADLILITIGKFKDKNNIRITRWI